MTKPAVRCAAVTAVSRLEGRGRRRRFGAVLPLRRSRADPGASGSGRGLVDRDRHGRARTGLPVPPAAARASRSWSSSANGRRAPPCPVLLEAGGCQGSRPSGTPPSGARNRRPGPKTCPPFIGLILSTPRPTRTSCLLQNAAGRRRQPDRSIPRTRADAVLAALKKAPHGEAGRSHPAPGPDRRGQGPGRPSQADLKDTDPAGAGRGSRTPCRTGRTPRPSTGFSKGRGPRPMPKRGIWRFRASSGCRAGPRRAARTHRRSWKAAFDLAAEHDEKNVVLSGFGGRPDTRVGPDRWPDFFDGPRTQDQAAAGDRPGGAARPPGFEGLTGFEAAQILQEGAALVESDYDREQAETYARDLLLKEGFRSAFQRQGPEPAGRAWWPIRRPGPR